MDPGKDAVRRHYQESANHFRRKYSSDSEAYPAEQIRLKILQRRLSALGTRTLLDCGCGEGTPLAVIHGGGVEVWGFDFVEEMTAQADALLVSEGLKNRVWRGDITDAASFRPEGIEMPDRFDACIALGVFPHFADEAGALRNMAAALSEDGRVFVSFRNELFSLFTLNRYAHEFFLDRLVDVARSQDRLPEWRETLAEMSGELEPFFRMDLPPVRKGKADAPGYDEILSRFHNPLEMPELFKAAGFRDAELHFYHFHAFPPLFEKGRADPFRNLSLAMEKNPNDWRGYFMASAFVVEAVKESGRP